MNEHIDDDLDASTDEIEHQLRARMRALADEVAGRTDDAAAFERLLRRSGPSTARILAIAACVLTLVAVAVAVGSEPETVGTTDQATPVDCPSTTEGASAPTPTPGEEMNTRLTAPAAVAALLFVGACGDDGPTLLARGQDIEIVGGGDGLAGQTLNIDARLEDGEATGEFRVGDIVSTVRCAATSTDGVVILGGEVTSDPNDDPLAEIGQVTALVIREGEPDGVTLGGDDTGSASCTEFIESLPENVRDGTSDAFLDLEAGSDIETA